MSQNTRKLVCKCWHRLRALPFYDKIAVGYNWGVRPGKMRFACKGLVGKPVGQTQFGTGPRWEDSIEMKSRAFSCKVPRILINSYRCFGRACIIFRVVDFWSSDTFPKHRLDWCNCSYLKRYVDASCTHIFFLSKLIWSRALILYVLVLLKKQDERTGKIWSPSYHAQCRRLRRTNCVLE